MVAALYVNTIKFAAAFEGIKSLHAAKRQHIFKFRKELFRSYSSVG
jgi:hypothetical protein